MLMKKVHLQINRTDPIISDKDRYLVLKLVMVWWEHCVHQTPLHGLQGTMGFHTSQDLKTRDTKKKQLSKYMKNHKTCLLQLASKMVNAVFT